MSRFFFGLVTVLLLVLPGFAMVGIMDQFPDSQNLTRQRAELRGPVQRVRSYVRQGGVLLEELVYDRWGHLVLENGYLQDSGVSLWKHQFRYDARGRLLKATSTGGYTRITGASCAYSYSGNVTTMSCYDEKGKVKYRRTYTTDSAGHLLATQVQWRDEKTGKMAVTTDDRFQYDAQGRLVKTISRYPHTGRVNTTTVTYQCDAQRRLLRREEQHSDGRQRLEAYTPEGKVLELISLLSPQPGQTRPAGSFHQFHYYDAQGRLAEDLEVADEATGLSTPLGGQPPHVAADDPAVQARTEYRYDTAGHESERVSSTRIAGVLGMTERVTTKYTAAGLVSEVTLERFDPWHSPDPLKACQTVVQRWTYDSHGNWLTRPPAEGYTQATYRQIVYY